MVTVIAVATTVSHTLGRAGSSEGGGGTEMIGSSGED